MSAREGRGGNIRTRRNTPLATLALLHGLARLWWFNHRSAKARARRLAEG